MEPTNSKDTTSSQDTTGESVASTGADNSVSPTSANNSEALSGAPTRPSAIERQQAAIAARRHAEQVRRNSHARRLRSYRIGLVSLLVLFLIVAIGLVLVFPDYGKSLQKGVSAVLQAAENIAASHDLSPSTNSSPPVASSLPPTASSSPPTVNSSTANKPALITPSAQVADPAQATGPSQVTSTSQATGPSPASGPQITATKSIAEVAASGAISIPVADVSLRNRPELLEQLVQVYRSQLAHDPNDAAALTALNRLRERSLSELQTIITAGDDAATIRSLALVSRLFPELADNPQYKYLITRMDYIHRSPKDELAAKSESAAKPEEQSPSSTKTTAPAAIPPQTILPQTISPQTTPPKTISVANIAPKKNVSPSINSSAAVVKQRTENAVSAKPEIHVASITPGKMVGDRFVPGKEGNVFMVEISYRNFKNSEDQSEGLVASLGTPGAMALAEVPVDILGDRGTKSFLMEALLPGNVGEKYELNFILNGQFLASRTLRLSIPGQ